MKPYLLTPLKFLGVFTSLFFFTHVQADEIGMVTGSKTGTYIKFGNEIAAKAKSVGLNLIVKESEGSIDNLQRINSRENAAFAIVQSDVLGFLKRMDDPELNKIIDKLRLIFPFYNEEIHLFARKEIKSIQDLQGKRVVVGTEGSGTWLTATNILDISSVEPSETLNLSTTDAIIAVLMGEADAMFYVAGKPVRLFQNLNNVESGTAALLNEVHFVPLNSPAILKEYEVSELGTKEYSWLGQSVPTAAVKAVLVSFDFASKNTPYYKKRCQQLGILGQVIRSNLSDLQHNGHPKWKETNLDEKVGIWEMDACSRAASQASLSKSSKEALRASLKKSLIQSP